jgi:hypothetical protein
MTTNHADNGQSNSIAVPLSPELRELAERVAARKGVTPSEYLAGLVGPLIRRDGAEMEGGPAARPDTLDMPGPHNQGPPEPPADVRDQIRRADGGPAPGSPGED